MARPKGPHKEVISFRVTVETAERLRRQAKGIPLSTYLAEREEQITDEVTRRPSVRNARLNRVEVEPRFKKSVKS